MKKVMLTVLKGMLKKKSKTNRTLFFVVVVVISVCSLSNVALSNLFGSDL